MTKRKSEGSGNVFKIMDSRTGLYSTGGTYPSFNKKGKTWASLAHVKTHLSQFKAIPPEWEIVEIEMREVSHVPAEDHFKQPTSPWGRSTVEAKHWTVPKELVKGSVQWSDYVRKQQEGNMPTQAILLQVTPMSPQQLMAQLLKTAKPLATQQQIDRQLSNMFKPPRTRKNKG